MLLRFVLTICLISFASPVQSEEAKLGKDCGCEVDSYAVYGAGTDSCKIYQKEYSANPSVNDIDAAYGQSLGWIAGYISATNKHLKQRDLFNSDLDYIANLIFRWCQKNPDETVVDAINYLTDKALAKQKPEKLD